MRITLQPGEPRQTKGIVFVVATNHALEKSISQLMISFPIPLTLGLDRRKDSLFDKRRHESFQHFRIQRRTSH